jgi:predicted permease
MAQFFRDAWYALRGFGRSPVFTTVAILSLALGIGANTAIFTLIDQLILRLLPIRDPQNIVLLAGRGRHYGGNNGRNALSYPMYQDLRDRNQVFDGMMCRYALTLTIATPGQTEATPAELVSGNYFPLLAVQSAVGRVFTAADDLHTGGHPYAVLSYSWWQTRFAGNPRIIGQTIRANNYPLTIVGVAQPGFDGMEPGLPAKLFVPMTMALAVRPGFTNMYNRRQRWVNAFGRLKPGETIERAKAGLQPLFHQILDMEVRQPAFRNATAFDKEQFVRMSLDVMPGSQGNTNLRRQYEKPLWVLMGVVGLVLLIACANLASLLAGRAAARQREIAVRLAIGSGRSRLIRQLVTESVILAGAGGLLGVAIGSSMVRALLSFLPATLTGYTITSTPDLRMLAFTFVVSLLTGISFGLVPALQATNPNIAGTLKDQAGNLMGGAAQVSFRKMLVAAQVSLSLLLLIGGALFVRSLGNLRAVNPGFTAGNLIQFGISPRLIGYDVPRTRAFFDQLRQRLDALPGVRASGLAVVALLSNNEWDNSVTIEGYQKKPTEDIDPHYNGITPGYLDAMGIHVTAGRDFTVKDTADSPKVGLVNESFARRYFPEGRAVGHRIGMGSDPGTSTDIEIVGVVNDTRYESLRDEIPPLVMLPAVQRGLENMTVYVRTTRDPEGAFRSIRAAVHDLDANLPLIAMRTVATTVDNSLVTERLIALLSTAFGGLATLLAVIGLYGVMAYMVTRRSREIGIRMALGAKTASVLWLVMREVLLMLALGVAAGLPAAYVLTRVVQTQLYGVQPADPFSIGAATLLLTGVSILAGYVSAQRAASYDPVRVLRYE